MVSAETIWGNTVTENLDNFGKMDGPHIIEIDRTNSTMVRGDSVNTIRI